MRLLFFEWFHSYLHSSTLGEYSVGNHTLSLQVGPKLFYPTHRILNFWYSISNLLTMLWLAPRFGCLGIHFTLIFLLPINWRHSLIIIQKIVISSLTLFACRLPFIVIPTIRLSASISMGKQFWCTTWLIASRIMCASSSQIASCNHLVHVQKEWIPW